MPRLVKIALAAFLLFSPPVLAATDAPVPDSLVFRYNSFSAWCTPEKVYLHYDRSCYTAGETIWFMGWVRDASPYTFLQPSNFLYAEVLDGLGNAVVRVKIKRSGDGFPGYIELPDNLETGYYTLRAYTLWQLNSGSEYHFNDRIRIIGGTEKEAPQQEDPSDEVFISFWPEGGRFFEGKGVTMGFKAVDNRGRSVDFRGVLVSDTAGELCPVSTVYDGMGSFSFIPESESRYSVLDASGKMHPLPACSEDGATLQLHRRSDRYYIGALGFGGERASLLVRDVSELRPLAMVDLDGRVSSLILESSFFRPGINHLLLVDSRGRILSERQFYIYDEEAPVCRLDSAGVISLSGPGGVPLDGSCSVSVVRNALKGWQQSDGITSYMGLSSELKGRINNPYHYFDPQIPESERSAAMDLLMMIHGWRYYDMETITDLRGGKFRLRHVRERIQEIRGHIARWSSSNKMPRKFIFTFIIPGKNVFHSVNVDQGREFIIDSLDFEENTQMLINIGTSRLGSNYLPKWDGDPAAEPYIYKPAPGFAKAASIIEPVLSEVSPYDTLQAAVVTAVSGDDDVLVFGRNYREDLEYFKDMSLVEYLGMRMVAFEYDGENMYNRNRRARRSSSGATEDSDSFGSFDDEDKSGKVKLIVEDMEEVWWAYDMVRLGDLRSLSVSVQPDPFYGGDGGVVRISVKPGGDRHGAQRNPSLLYFVPLGYQPPRCFEQPRSEPEGFGPQLLRNTLWWSPEVQITGGQASVSFDCGEETDSPLVVRIEGFASDGRPFSHHCLFTPAGTP